MNEQARREYLARIHRAQDYIERNLAGPLALEDVARAACFSPYHFHRIFGAVTGETLHQFVLRLRLERAAAQLDQLPAKDITAVALDCGFSSSATFARAFRAAYGASASGWRASKDDRKKRKTVSKDGKAPADGSLHDGGMTIPMTVTPKNVTVENMEAFTVAYVRHVGPYAGDAELFQRLFGQLTSWAGPRGLLGPATKMLSIYHDNPEVTEESKLRTSVCVSVPAGTTPSGEVSVMEIPAGTCVRARFELSPTEFGGAWQWLMSEWFPSSGYQPDDRPCYELGLNDAREHPQGKFIVELTMPVRPL